MLGIARLCRIFILTVLQNSSTDQEVPGSNLSGGGIQPTVRRLIARSFSLSPFHRLDITLIILKGT